MSPQPVTIVFGGNRIGNKEPFTPGTDLKGAFKILLAHGVKSIDSAQAYGNSQATIGEVKAGDRFGIDTKWSGFGRGPPPGAAGGAPAGPPQGWATKEFIVNSAKDSVEKLGVKQVDIFYIHSPDPNTPIAETLAGVNEVHKQGLFRRFGLSNYKAPDVEAVHAHCVEKGYILPTVYQGPYHPLARHQETDLFPTLRKLGMAFYAYSPSAGGFLGKTVAEVEEAARSAPSGPGFRPLRMRLAGSQAHITALGKWNAVAEKEGIGRAEMAYRWDAYHSAMKKELGDALIVGASSLEQIEETLGAVEKGPLSAEAVAGIDKVWEAVKDEIPAGGPPRRS